MLRGSIINIITRIQSKFLWIQTTYTTEQIRLQQEKQQRASKRDKIFIKTSVKLKTVWINVEAVAVKISYTTGIHICNMYISSDTQTDLVEIFELTIKYRNLNKF